MHAIAITETSNRHVNVEVFIFLRSREKWNKLYFPFDVVLLPKKNATQTKKKIYALYEKDAVTDHICRRWFLSISSQVTHNIFTISTHEMMLRSFSYY